jgi:hypothetical protein
MSLFIENRLIMMLCFAAMAVITYLNGGAIARGKKITIRPLPALDAIDEAVGASAEQGRPVHFTPGFCKGGLYNIYQGPPYIAGLSLSGYIAECCAKHGARLFMCISRPEAVAMAQELIKIPYEAAGLKVTDDVTRFISDQQYPYASGTLAYIRTERPGANFMIGYQWSEALQLAEAGDTVGAINIGGTIGGAMPFFITTCDYCLIGEEIYAASAYISQDPMKLASIVGQDAFRLIAIGLSIILFIAANLGTKILVS